MELALNTDNHILNMLTFSDSVAIYIIYFVRMRDAFAYIRKYFSLEPNSAVNVIGEAYAVLS